MAGATSRRATPARRRPVGRSGGGTPPGLELLQGDSIEVLAGLADDTVDAVVTDPPYAIGWQHESWDGTAIREAAGRAGWGRLTRKDAFEVWCRMWARECARVMKPGAYLLAFGATRTFHHLACGLEDGGLEILDTLIWLFGSGIPKSHRLPGGRSTTLKPAFEPITLARAPRGGATIMETIERHGTGALNTDACRTGGRHPANLLASHEPGCDGGGCAPGCAVALIDSDAGRGAGSAPPVPSRFLYCPRVSRAEREAGCEGLPARSLDHFPRGRVDSPTRNPHPTVKPLELMRWLVRLACPPGGLVLDPFAGSGTTGAAAAIEGRRFLGIELEAPYVEIAAARIAHWAPSPAAGPKAGWSKVSGETVEVRLAPESVEELAARLAEALRRPAGDEDGSARVGEEKISAAEVARRWGVARRWVYDHADALGALRLGDGPRPRLRFDPAEVAERLGAPAAGSRSDRRLLPPMRADPHSDSLSMPHRATVGGQRNQAAGRRTNAPGPAPKDKRHRASAR